MKDQPDLKIILKKGNISNELELERALIIERKLRLLVKENPELSEDRKVLRTIIKNYENANWSKNSNILVEQIKESDSAELIAEQERKFLDNRKEVIKKKLALLNLTQNDLATILHHNKSYMSELMNGICPFSTPDLIIIHRIFGIKLEYLIPTFISPKLTGKLKLSISKLNKPDLKLKKNNLTFA